MTFRGFCRPPCSHRGLTALLLCLLVLTAGCTAGVHRDPAETRDATASADPAAAHPSPSAHEVEGLLEPLESVLDHEVLTEDEFVPDAYDEAAHDDLATLSPELTAEEIERGRALASVLLPRFDFPVEVNEKVLRWVDFYSNTNKTRFQPGLVRSGRYLQMFRRIFAEEGIPQDLVYMAHVESAYKTNAYSRAHAKGIFQFISSTGRRYGLRIDWWVDERSDPEKAAHASARYLKKLYGDFGDWYLALAAYNGGEGRVRKAIRRTGKKDFWALARTRHLRRETRNYVPAILAATLISKQPRKYGFEFEPDAVVEYDTITVDGAADLRVLGKCAGSDFETMKFLNPALRRYQTPPDGRTDVRVPRGTAEKTLAALAEVPRNRRVLYARHRVRRGDTLSGLARKYGVSVSGIQAANRMGRRTMIREGKVLVIPTVAARDYSAGRGDAVVASKSGSGPVRYRVRRGDNLSRIARKYGTTPSAIAAASGIRVNGILSIGQRLTVVPGVRSASAARRIASGEDGAAASGNGKVVHTVRRGDTLWRIASRYRTSVDRLCTLNRISKHDKIYPGMKLTVQ